MSFPLGLATHLDVIAFGFGDPQKSLILGFGDPQGFQDFRQDPDWVETASNPSQSLLTPFSETTRRIDFFLAGTHLLSFTLSSVGEPSRSKPLDETTWVQALLGKNRRACVFAALRAQG